MLVTEHEKQQNAATLNLLNASGPGEVYANMKSFFWSVCTLLIYSGHTLDH